MIAIDAADRKRLEEKVFRHLAKMPPLRGEGEDFRKRLTRNREGNMMREEYHQGTFIYNFYTVCGLDRPWDRHTGFNLSY